MLRSPAVPCRSTHSPALHDMTDRFSEEMQEMTFAAAGYIRVRVQDVLQPGRSDRGAPPTKNSCRWGSAALSA
jgi:hypothetical protein